MLEQSKRLSKAAKQKTKNSKLAKVCDRVVVKDHDTFKDVTDAMFLLMKTSQDLGIHGRKIKNSKRSHNKQNIQNVRV